MPTIQERVQLILKKLQISNKNDILFKAIPRIGAASYVLYSTKFLAPKDFSR
jgi:hypothetical protein